MTEYICLSCWYLLNSRHEKALKRCCSKCKSRAVINLESLARVVSDTKNWMGSNKGKLNEIPIQAAKEVPSLKAMLEGSSFEKGLVSLDKVIELANDWNPKKLSAEEHIILMFRQWAKDTKKETTNKVVKEP